MKGGGITLALVAALVAVAYATFPIIPEMPVRLRLETQKPFSVLDYCVQLSGRRAVEGFAPNSVPLGRFLRPQGTTYLSGDERLKVTLRVNRQHQEIIARAETSLPEKLAADLRRCAD